MTDKASQPQRSGPKRLVRIALIAAIYTVLSLAVAPIAFGPIQFRVGELLTVLPGYTVLAVPGLTLGCALTNFLGAILGINLLGGLDAVVGSFATLIAGSLSYLLGKLLQERRLRYLLIPLPPVLVNAVIIGSELAVLFAEEGQAFVAVFLVNFISILIGQAVICYGLGIPLMMLLERHKLRERLFG